MQQFTLGREKNLTIDNNITRTKEVLDNAIKRGNLSEDTKKVFEQLGSELFELESALWARNVREPQEGEIDSAPELASIKKFNKSVKTRTNFFTGEKSIDEADGSTLRINSDLSDDNFIKNIYENAITDASLSLRGNMDSISKASDPSIPQRVALVKEAFEKTLRILSEPDIQFSERKRFIDQLQTYIMETLPDNIIATNTGAKNYRYEILAKLESYRKNATSRTKQFGSWSKRKIKEESGNLAKTGLKKLADNELTRVLGVSGWLQDKIEKTSFGEFGRKINDKEAVGIRGALKSVSPIMPKEESENKEYGENKSPTSPFKLSKDQSNCCKQSNRILQAILKETITSNNLIRQQRLIDRQKEQIGKFVKKPVEFKKIEPKEKKEGLFDNLLAMMALRMLLPMLAGIAAAVLTKIGLSKLGSFVLDKFGDRTNGIPTTGGLGRTDTKTPPENKKDKKSGKTNSPTVNIPPVDTKETGNKKERDTKSNKKEMPCVPICKEVTGLGKDKDKKTNPDKKDDQKTKRDRIASARDRNNPDIKKSTDVKDTKSVDVKDTKSVDVKKDSILKKAGNAAKAGGRAITMIPGAGWVVGGVVAAGTAAYEAYNADETMGRKTTGMEKLAVGAAGMIPFVDTKETADRIINWMSPNNTSNTQNNITRGEAKGLVKDPLQEKQVSLLGQLVELQTDTLKQSREKEQIVEGISEDSQDGEVSPLLEQELGLSTVNMGATGSLPDEFKIKMRKLYESIGMKPAEWTMKLSTDSPETVQTTQKQTESQKQQSGKQTRGAMKISNDVSGFYKSSTASSKGIGNVPVQGSVEESNSKYSQNILNNMQEKVFGGKMVLTSGYRSRELNSAIGGAVQSDHQKGLAADIVVPGMKPIEVAQQVASSGVPFDKLIVEPSWVHVSFPKPGSNPQYKVWSMSPSVSTEAVQQSVSVNKNNSSTFTAQNQTSQSVNSQASTEKSSVKETNKTVSDEQFASSLRTIKTDNADGTIKQAQSGNMVAKTQPKPNNIMNVANQSKTTTSIAPVSNSVQSEKMEYFANQQAGSPLDLTDATINKLAAAFARVVPSGGNSVVAPSQSTPQQRQILTTNSPVSVGTQITKPL